MTTYIPTIGLEIHAELKTRTKMFCNSKNDTGELQPNVNVCPVCMGHPGTLPTINKEAVKHVLKVGVALGGELADFTEFDRKNYFYPDIPKGYQISQYKYPLVKGGSLAGVLLTRIHLEEDTAKSSHEGSEFSLVDFNRAGVPLMELVTEPTIHTATDASKFAKELQLLLGHLGVTDANMEKGEMRVEANISVSTQEEMGEGKLGTKIEVKNLNSFRSVEKAIEYEILRHTELLTKGGKVVQETRGWDEDREETFSQRRKEDSHDYRYFPDPDLPKLYISEIKEFHKDVLTKELPELPWATRERYTKDFDLKDEDIEIYVTLKQWGTYFEKVLQTLPKNKKLIKLASNYISSDLLGLVKKNQSLWDENTLSPENFGKLIQMIDKGLLSSRGAKDTLAIMYEKGGDPEKIAEDGGFIQKNNEDELRSMVLKIIADNEVVAAEYKKGKEVALQFLIGQGMKATKGSANPEILKKLLISILG